MFLASHEAVCLHLVASSILVMFQIIYNSIFLEAVRDEVDEDDGDHQQAVGVSMLAFNALDQMMGWDT